MCEGLEGGRLFLGDIACFTDDGAEHLRDLARFLERLTKFNLKLSRPKRLI